MNTHAAGLVREVRRAAPPGDTWVFRVVAALSLALLPSDLESQSGPLQARAGLVVEGVSLNDALLTLRRTAGVPIAFSPDMLPAARVTCQCGSVTVGEALRTLLEGTSLTFRSTDTQVLILAAPSRARGEPDVVRGRVVDAETGNPIPDALVDLETGHGAISDASGLFRLNAVSPGPHRLRVRKIGFEPWTLDSLNVASRDTGTFEVALRRAAVRLPDVTVAPGTFGLLDALSPGAAVAVTRQQVQVLPQMGEDIFRAMIRLPGVTSSDVSTRLNVRGSLEREVSTRLDGLELYNPYHLNDWEGAFGIIDLNALGGATVRAGGFGVEYGGRAGAVTDMTSSPVLGLPATNLGFSISNVTALKQGSFGGERGTWLASVRRGSLGLLMDMVGADDRLSPQFYDAFAKVTWQPTQGHLVSARLLRAADDLSIHIKDAWDGVHAVVGPEEGSLDTRWTSTYGWASWEARSGSGHTAATTMAWTGEVDRFRDGFILDLGREVGNDRVSVVDDRAFTFAGARESIAVELGANVLLSGGAEVRWGDASYEYRSATRVPVLVGGTTRGIREDATAYDGGHTGRDLAMWGSLRARPLRPLTLDAGLRYDRASHTADANLAPRFLGSLALGERATIQASLGRYVASQGLHELNVSDGETAYAPAEITTMAAAGVALRLASSVDARMDLYRRVTARPRPQYISLQQTLRVFPEVEDDRLRIDPIRGRAQGMELSLHGRAGAEWDWSAAYALARAEDEVREAQRCGSDVRCAGTGWVPRSHDQRHSVSAQATWRPDEKWHLTTAWLFHSGWPGTAWTYHGTNLSDGSVFLTRTFHMVNGARLPAYHRLDLRATRTWTVRSGRLDVFVDLFNTYNRANEVSFDYGASVVNGSVRTERQEGETMLPFLPTLGLRYRR